MFKRKFKNLEKLLDISTNQRIIDNVMKLQNNKTNRKRGNHNDKERKRNLRFYKKTHERK